MFYFTSLVGRLDMQNFRAMGMKTNRLGLVALAISSHFPHPAIHSPLYECWSSQLGGQYLILKVRIADETHRCAASAWLQFD